MIFLFASVHNACRSQMAAAFFNHYANFWQFRAFSAGTHPASHVSAGVLQVMQEVGLDLSEVHPQRLTPELACDASVLVTMGQREACPQVPGLKIVNWSIAEPQGRSLDELRRIRDDIHDRVKALLQSEVRNHNRT